jgi:hypothetical protein
MEEDRFPQNSTPAEIAKLIFEATTKIDTAKSLVGNFTIYELRDSDGGDMTLCIYVENLLLPRGGYKYNLADQRGMLFDAA